jgi:hypothetical protein
VIRPWGTSSKICDCLSASGKLGMASSQRICRKAYLIAEYELVAVFTEAGDTSTACGHRNGTRQVHFGGESHAYNSKLYMLDNIIYLAF